jgi:hypothetical protein
LTLGSDFEPPCAKKPGGFLLEDYGQLAIVHS